MRKYGEKMNLKHKVQSVQNSRTNLGYMEESERGYSWTDYVTREDILEVPGF